MKLKISLLIIVLTIANHANSQIEKRNWMIGGAGSFRSSNYNNGVSKQNILQLNGDVGYFILNKLTAGLKPGYERTGTKGNFSPNNVVISTYYLGPFARYYFLPVNKRVNIFSELSYQYGIMRTSQGVSQNSNNYTGYIGCAAFFNNCVALEFTLGYSSYLYNNNSGKVNSVIAGVGFQFHLEKEK